MKKTIFALTVLLTFTFFACKKNSDSSQISLTPSTTQVIVGQQVSVNLSATQNASNWTVTPSATVTKTYGLTTSKVNYFTFSQAGTYFISVRARNVNYDSTKQSLASAWNTSGAATGTCTKGIDTASLSITVLSK